jgi:plasmid stabilization system protein ParE
MEQYTIVFASKAQNEYEESVLWYLKKSEEVSLKFIVSLEDTIQKIVKNPFINKNLYKRFYEINIKKYPFTIVYVIDKKEIIIISIYHQKRNPKYKISKKK